MELAFHPGTEVLVLHHEDTRPHKHTEKCSSQHIPHTPHNGNILNTHQLTNGENVVLHTVEYSPAEQEWSPDTATTWKMFKKPNTKGHMSKDSVDRKCPEQANLETESKLGVARGQEAENGE